MSSKSSLALEEIVQEFKSEENFVEISYEHAIRENSFIRLYEKDLSKSIHSIKGRITVSF